ncbi:MAG TPA: hypothetical protein ENH85_06840 [Candidatus Scalindua sp.]|nr:hypothetical protein [Candidatus Scalindua sp.]
MKKENTKKAKYCKGCKWLYVGINVSHNHCDYFEGPEQEKRVNGHIEYISYDGGKTDLLTQPSSVCRYYWNENNPPIGSRDNCPKIPEEKRNE